MSGIVRRWYEDRQNVDEMKRWDSPKLKIWERNVTEHFPPAATVLDIGCGLCREAFALSDMGFRVTGVDISREVISQAKELADKRGYAIPLHLYDGRSLPFEAASFDVVIIWAQTFGLLYGDEYKRELLSECRRVLSCGGLLSFSGHDCDYLARYYPSFLKDGRFYPYLDTDIYWETFDADGVSTFAKNAGYEVLLCEKGEIYKPEDGTVLHCLCRK